MKLKLKELAVFGMLGALMCASKLVMEVLPNIHLLGVFTIAITAVYRRKALYPIYISVLLLGLYYGFPTWWIPHLYLWTVLWAVTMLLPKRHPLPPLIYMLLCAGHGLVYGTLYAPSQALLYGMNLQATLAWIVAGLPFDAIHAAANFACGLLIIPLIRTMQRADRWVR